MGELTTRVYSLLPQKPTFSGFFPPSIITYQSKVYDNEYFSQHLIQSMQKNGMFVQKFKTVGQK